MNHKMKTLEKHLRSDGDSVVLVPLTGLEIKNRYSERATLFGIFPGSKLLRPKDFNKFIGKEFLAKNIVDVIGKMEAGTLNNNYLALIPLTGIIMDQKKAIEVLDSINGLLLNFAHNLWHSKDNCVNIDTGYLLVYDNNNPLRPHIIGNRLINHFFDAHGDNKGTEEFDHGEIKKAARCASELIALHPDEADLTHQKPATRIYRFEDWISYTRQQSDLSMRITMYIIALEALLSTRNDKLTHQLGQRLALLTPTPPEATLIKDTYTYKQIKKAYGFRSRTVHGDAVKKKNRTELIEMSKFLDELCRQLLNEIIKKREFQDIFKDSKTIDAFFEEKLF